MSAKNDDIDDMEPVPMADVLGTVATYTVDRLAYSPSPPVVFAVVDFDGGGRLPLEFTDVEPDGVTIGMRVEMTFRRLNTSDGIHNYFWKGRPVRPDGTIHSRTGGSHGLRTASRTKSRSSAPDCIPFREHWDKGTDDMLIEASDLAFKIGRCYQTRCRRLLARHRAVGHGRHHACPSRSSSTASP